MGQIKRLTGIEISVFTIVASILIISPFSRGLFNGGQINFEQPIYITTFIGALLLILISTKLLLKNNIPLRWYIVTIVAIIPLVRMIGSFTSVSIHTNLIGWLLSILYVSFLIAGALLARNGLKYLVIIIMLTGYMIVIFGWGVLFNTFDYKDAIINGRLGSVFQYPNTYASYITALLIGNLYLISKTNSKVKLINLMMTFPLIFSLFLTFSRGGLLVFGIVFIVYLFTIKTINQVVHLLHLVTIGLIGFVAYIIYFKGIYIKEGMTSSESVFGWMILFSLMLLSAGSFYAIEYMIDKSRVLRKHINPIIVPCVIITLGIIMIISLLFGAFDNIGGIRLFDINLKNSNILDRGIFYIDAIKIISDYPALGVGGGGWIDIYESYQSNPYQSNQIHNYFLQLLVEYGIVGFLLEFGIIFWVMYRFVRTQLKDNTSEKTIFFLISLSILLHSIIDFDLSFAYISIILYLSIGVLSSSNYFGLNEKNFSKGIRMTARISIVVLLLMSILAAYTSIQFYKANAQFQDALKSNQFEQVSTMLKKAMSLNRYNPIYSIYMTDILIHAFQETNDSRYLKMAEDEVIRISRFEHSDINIVMQKYKVLFSEKKYDEADELILSEIAKYRWNSRLFELAIQTNYQSGMNANNQNIGWDVALNYYTILTKNIKSVELENYELFNKQYFRRTPNIALSIGKIYYEKANYQKAEEVLKPAVTTLYMNTYPFNDIMMYYMSSLKMQGKSDINLSNFLSKHHPDIEKIINEMTSGS